jgi:hypothetical protein
MCQHTGLRLPWGLSPHDANTSWEATLPNTLGIWYLAMGIKSAHRICSKHDYMLLSCNLSSGSYFLKPILLRFKFKNSTVTKRWYTPVFRPPRCDDKTLRRCAVWIFPCVMINLGCQNDWIIRYLEHGQSTFWVCLGVFPETIHIHSVNWVEGQSWMKGKSSNNGSLRRQKILPTV